MHTANRSRLRQVVRIGVSLIVVCAGNSARADERPTPAQVEFFESKIRPVLVDKCYACHSEVAKKSKGDLLLDTRAGTRAGGVSGPAVVPGKLDESLLLDAIRYGDADLAMPPKDAGGKLSASVIRDFEEWIRQGAPDPREGGTVKESPAKSEAAKNWWSFQPVRAVAVPPVEDESWPVTDIDRFILAKLEQRGLRPAPDADPLTLVRRLRFDLTGLPPTVEESREFARNWLEAKTPLEALGPSVNTLLASRQYGERWGRRWLDVARYAESSGKDVNVVFPHAWRYRDYVIDAFHRDKPFDRFLVEQLAGDLLPAKNDIERAELTVATGFLAIGPKSLNETQPKQFAVDLADEQIDAVTQAFMGLTVACARCHDHKFDPITQRDYTALAGVFLSTDTRYGTAGGVRGRNRAALLELQKGAKARVVAEGLPLAEVRAKQTRLERLRQQQRESLGSRAGGKEANDGLTGFDLVRIATQITQLELELGAVTETGAAKPLAMGVVDRPRTLPQQRGPRGRRPGAGRGEQPSGFEAIGDSPLFARGDIDNVGARVPRGVAAIIAPNAESIPEGASGRLELARALASPRHPMVSRVIVNRVWKWLFGRGLVDSVDNFGTTGDLPSHPELLDHLSARFVKEGWSIKRLVREIVVSRVYRQSTRFDDANFAADPENALAWRHTPRRLEAEEIRDAMLAVSGRLDPKPVIGSLIGRAEDGPVGGERRMSLTVEQLARADHAQRSIYLPLARNAPPDVLAAFDFPESAAVDGARDSTNVPNQALFLLNSEFVENEAERFARRILVSVPARQATDKLEDRLKLAFAMAFGRHPKQDEVLAAKPLLERHDTDPVRAWTGIARSLFASAEFRLLD